MVGIDSRSGSDLCLSTRHAALNLGASGPLGEASFESVAPHVQRTAERDTLFIFLLPGRRGSIDFVFRVDVEQDIVGERVAMMVSAAQHFEIHLGMFREPEADLPLEETDRAVIDAELLSVQPESRDSLS